MNLPAVAPQARAASLVCALAALAALVPALHPEPADARGPSHAHPWSLRAAADGATRLGPIRLRAVSVRELARRVGGPARVRRRGNRCVARWPRAGLRATLVVPRGGDANPCGRAGRVAQIVLAGRAARGRYRTDRGVAIGARAGLIARRHRSAVRRSKRLWWLRRADSSLTGRPVGVAQARVGGGRVRALVGLTGVTTPGIGAAERGVWTGAVEGDRTTDYELTMALRGGSARRGERVGSIDYSRLDCGGTLTLVGRTLTELRLAETIVYGAERCVDRGAIRFSIRRGSGGRWSYRGTSADATGRRLSSSPSRADVPVDVSDRIDPAEAGSWTGAVAGDDSAYDVALSLDAGPMRPGGTAGQVRYPQLGCAGSLTYLARTFATIVLRESVDGGGCESDGVETFRLDGPVAHWTYDRRLTATLARP